MKRINQVLILFLLFFVPACTQRVPAQDAVPSLQEVIAHTFDLVKQNGWPSDTDYETTDMVEVKFPNGDKGVFGTIGIASGPLHGYMFLYRIQDEKLKTVLLSPSGPLWGLRSFQSKWDDPDNRTHIEFLDLLIDKEGRSRQTLRFSGAGHSGSGLFSDGVFGIIEITENGIDALFMGEEGSTTLLGNSMIEVRYSYEYVDLSGDRNKEIVQDQETCEYRLDLKTFQKTEKMNCKNSRATFIYNGTQFKKSD